MSMRCAHYLHGNTILCEAHIVSKELSYCEVVLIYASLLVPKVMLYYRCLMNVPNDSLCRCVHQGCYLARNSWLGVAF